MSEQQQTVGTPFDVRDRDRYRYAFDYWARRYPDSFSAVAPELLREAVNASKDHVEMDKLESWLENQLPEEDFQIELKTPRTDFDPVPFQYSRYGVKNRAWIDTLEDRFIIQEGHRRWGRAVRDQFIILGMIASEPEGVNQGRIVTHLGIPVNEEASRRYAGNMVRAAKIALSRLAKKAGFDEDIFKPAKNHGVNRIYAFKDERFRKLTYKWVMSLPAGEWIPEPLTEE